MIEGICESAGEWWNADPDPEAVIAQALQTGGGPNVSDVYTINGLPGPLYDCSSKGVMTNISLIQNQKILQYLAKKRHYLDEV